MISVIPSSRSGRRQGRTCRARCRCSRWKRPSAILKADEKEILTITPVSSPPPEEAKIRGSLRCAVCGEKFMESRSREKNGKIVCIPCFEKT